MDGEGHEPLSPEVRQRLAKLKELNDGYNVSDEDFEVETAPSKTPPKTKQVRKKKATKGRQKKSTEMSYTVEKILETANHFEP